MNNPSSDSPQWTQMRQEIMDLLRAELQNDLQSQVDQLKEKVAQETKRGEAEKSELKQRCDALHHSNALLLKRQLKGEHEISQLQEKLDSLQTSFDRAERKAKYLEVISKNHEWEYPLAVPTTHMLMLDGFNRDDEIEDIIRGIDHIRDVTTQMRKGENIDIFMPMIPIPTGMHYEAIFPHYKQFANALMEYKRTINYMEHETFHFEMGGEARLRLPAEVMLLLQEALEHTHFHQLVFYPIQTEGNPNPNEFHRIQTMSVRYLDFISNCVRENTRLEVFRLVNVTIENSRDIDLLCEVLNNKASLREIEMTSCGTEGGVFREIFNKLRNENMKKIDLTYNRLSNLRPTDVSEFLSSNPSLRDLDLCSNPFNEQDIVYIVDALRHNTTLRFLRFRFRNPPTNFFLLDYAIFDSTSLNAVFDSNHVCRLFLDGITSNSTKFNTYSDPKLNRKKKIYALLSKRNRRRENAAVFEQDGIAIKHIPQILSLLKPFSEHCHQTLWKQEEDEVKPLSIAYEIMRDWRMPELYNSVLMDQD